MSERSITFEEMPKAMGRMMAKLDELGSKLEEMSKVARPRVEEHWMSLKEL